MMSSRSLMLTTVVAALLVAGVAGCGGSSSSTKSATATIAPSSASTGVPVTVSPGTEPPSGGVGGVESSTTTSAPAATATTQATISGGTSVTFANLTVTLPAGWVMVREADTADYACAESSAEESNQMQLLGCNGLTFTAGSSAVAGPGAPPVPYQPNLSAGWYTAGDVEPCPVNPSAGAGGLNGVETGGAPIAEGFRPVGSHTADWDEWSASCQNGYTFRPQAWWLPTSHVLIKDYNSNPDTPAILASVTFAS
jgi:hypothetical protein